MTVDPQMLLRSAFPGMDENALSEMARLAMINTYPADTVLCHEGAEEEVFYLLGDGQVVITQRLGDEDRLLRYGNPGDYFGEMALIANTPRNATVRTITEATVLEIDKATFIEMIRQNPVIALTMFRTSVGWLRANDKAAIDGLSRQKRELEEAYFELQTQEGLRTEFLTTLAHELRTPLTSATGFMQLLKNAAIAGPARDMALDRISSNLDRIVSLVNDLLFVQEMDFIDPVIRPINLPKILTSIVDEAQDRAAANNLVIKKNLPSALPEIQADVDSLMRAFNALLDNSIKFSPEGGEIQINVTLSESMVNVGFKDPGIGIEPDFMPRLFRRFERREKRGQYLFGGIGLGLPIAKHLVESFGGSINVESEMGQGSTFTVSLPYLAAKVG